MALNCQKLRWLVGQCNEVVDFRGLAIGARVELASMRALRNHGNIDEIKDIIKTVLKGPLCLAARPV